MKKHFNINKTVSLLLAGSILLSSCTSTTMIQSTPSGAKVYLNGEPVGTTPYEHSDTRIVGSTTRVKLTKEGFETLYTSFSRDEEVDIGAIVAGVIIFFPFIWTMKYKPSHTYELIPSIAIVEPAPTKLSPNQISIKTKAERIKEFKQLLDEKIITQEEFDKEKKKILDEEK